MNTEEIAKKVVELVRKQAWYEALDTLYDDNIVSVEAFSMSGGSPVAGNARERSCARQNRLVGQRDGNPQLRRQRSVCWPRSFCRAIRCRCYRQKFETAAKIIRSRRLHGKGWKDHPRRVPATRRLRFTHCESRIAFAGRHKSPPYIPISQLMWDHCGAGSLVTDAASLRAGCVI